MEEMLNKEKVNDVLTPDSHIDEAEFEWVGQDTEKMMEIGRPSISYWKDAMTRLKKDKVALFFIGVLLIITLLAIIIPFVYPISGNVIH